MPEGDTIFRTARTLRQALEGRAVVGFSSRVAQVRGLGPQRVVGSTVTAVEPRGKHLLVWLDPAGLVLHTHMRMTGSWHLYRSDQRWSRPASQARVVVEVDGWTAVCFNAPAVALLTREQVDRHPVLSALGPDALGDEVDLAEARRRLDARLEWTAGEALLDQRVLAGVGNVYKCEVLFIHSVDPWTPVGDLDETTRDALLETSVRLLKANVGPTAAPRTTTITGGGPPPARAGAGRPRLYVYGRGGRGCLRCATPIRVAQQGEQGRLTYWCPRCQGPGVPPARKQGAA